MLALLGLLAVAGYQHRDKLGQLLGGIGGGSQPDNARDRNPAAPQEQDSGGIGGFLGGLFGGGNSEGGGGIAGGLRDLIDSFTGHGQGDTAKSWVESGPNREMGTSELEQALGEDSIGELMRQTGLTRDELILRLRAVLPTAVDRLTPEGRLPNDDDEVARWAGA
jgi:uncharacterized protein YidB (DUF937 family)